MVAGWTHRAVQQLLKLEYSAEFRAKFRFLKRKQPPLRLWGGLEFPVLGTRGSKRAKFQAEACGIKTMAREPAASHVSF